MNEYGLQAAYSFLGVANKAFILRANVNTSDLLGATAAPTERPDDGTYWFDLTSSSIGLFGTLIFRTAGCFGGSEIIAATAVLATSAAVCQN